MEGEALVAMATQQDLQEASEIVGRELSAAAQFADGVMRYTTEELADKCGLESDEVESAMQKMADDEYTPVRKHDGEWVIRP